MTWLNLVSFLHGLGVFGSFTILPVYMRDLGGTDFLVSLSMALFYLLRGSLNFLSGPLSDSSGRRKLITLALALFSLSHVCYALSRTPTAILASIALQATAAGASIVWAVFSVGMPLWLRDLGASYSSLVEDRSPEGRVGASMGMLKGLRDMFTLRYLLAFGSLTQWVDMRLAFGFEAFVLLGLSTIVWVHLKHEGRKVCRSLR